MPRNHKIFLVEMMGLVAILLCCVRTDREFINLTPSPSGTQNSVSLETGHVYSQKFPATRLSVSRVGLYLRPQTRTLTESAVAVDILVSGQIRAREKVFTSFIDAEGINEIRLAQPLPVSPGEEITITLSVPPELSGQIGALTRLPDETFNSDYAQFSIDDTPSAATLAYQVYYRYHPPLAWQMAGLLLLLASCMILPWKKNSHITIIALSLVLATLAALPALLLGSFPWILVLVTAAAWYGMAYVLLRFNLGLPAVVLGASVFAFTTWWPLHFAHNWSWTNEVLGQAVSLQNIFLDSNQVSSANGGNFEHYGSYVGLIATALSFLGMVVTIRIKKYFFYFAITLLTPFLAILIPDLIIVTTLGLAWFAAQGLSTLQNFLGKDSLVTVLSWVIVIVVLLDLFHVSTGTLEFSLL